MTPMAQHLSDIPATFFKFQVYLSRCFIRRSYLRGVNQRLGSQRAERRDV